MFKYYKRLDEASRYKFPRNTVNKSRSWRHNDFKYVSILLETSFNIKRIMSSVK
jgi:hypothetical protein